MTVNKWWILNGAKKKLDVIETDISCLAIQKRGVCLSINVRQHVCHVCPLYFILKGGLPIDMLTLTAKIGTTTKFEEF